MVIQGLAFVWFRREDYQRIRAISDDEYARVSSMPIGLAVNDLATNAFKPL